MSDTPGNWVTIKEFGNLKITFPFQTLKLKRPNSSKQMWKINVIKCKFEIELLKPTV
jgi:hypothetical protein